ncbi:hypothetical protein D9758_005705 [Tetrapyrgos nigripes]|uniref:Uncharacterized protein n=1 Tax=Tetrapyrgos nigripes TaxID=182062 RepID=A0A8H5GJJ7_9AGAR|nr:hypothetical protein D9758_005705 [Tetrapyrgos nigripes]
MEGAINEGPRHVFGSIFPSPEPQPGADLGLLPVTEQLPSSSTAGYGSSSAPQPSPQDATVITSGECQRGINIFTEGEGNCLVETDIYVLGQSDGAVDIELGP